MSAGPTASRAAAQAWILGDDGWQPAGGLPPTDRVVRYGMAVFETIAVRDGEALFADAHASLLEESAGTLLGLGADRIPRDWPMPAGSPRGMLRVYITAGDGAPHDPVTAPRCFALFEELSAGHLPDAQTACTHASPVDPFGHGRKTANYWAHCAAQAEARAAGSDHALLQDHRGNILSCAFGNVFFVLGGELCTPSCSLSVRPGVIRAWVMRKQAVREVEFPTARLHEASEIFVTNSRLGVMPLHFGTIAPGPVGRHLQAAARREKISL